MKPRGRAAAAALALALWAGAGHAQEPMTLPQALRQALTANPTVASQAVELERQRLERQIARGERAPALGLEASYTSYSHPTLVTSIREAGVFPPLDRDIGRLGLVLDLPLYAGGRLLAGESLALHRHEAATHGLAGAEQDLLYDVTATYVKALHLRDLQRSSRARIAAFEREESHLEAQLAQGRVARLDLMRLQTQLSESRHDLLVLEQAERDARSLLAALLGEDGPMPPLTDSVSGPVNLPTTREEALARALDRRPDLLRAEALARAASDQVDIAVGERRPRVSLVGQVQESAGSDWRGYDDAQIGVQVSLPVFDGSIRRRRVDQARLAQRRSTLEVEQAGLRIATEIEQSHGAVSTSRARLAVAEQGEQEAVESLRIETARYHAGESTISDLLDADAAYWGAVTDRLQAGYDLVTSQARLLHATGELSVDHFEWRSAQAATATTQAGAGR